MKLIDYKDARPIYEQICEGYKKLILKGVLAPGDQMPSVRSLAMELSANPNTVQKAYSELERQGYIYTVIGKGNYVRFDGSLIEEKKKELAASVRELIKEAAEIGIGAEELFSLAAEKGSDQE
ncbi:MAG: GntR family transcriptional regulator [Lachnospiraceae bacterium]|nr:GntR family transcriptional regulator [Lachnospiraceae bacterium]